MKTLFLTVAELIAWARRALTATSFDDVLGPAPGRATSAHRSRALRPSAAKATHPAKRA